MKQIVNNNSKGIEVPIYDDWECYLFGSNEENGICWTPLKGKVPNWFWRKMQFLIFGNTWVKVNEE